MRSGRVGGLPKLTDDDTTLLRIWVNVGEQQRHISPPDQAIGSKQRSAELYRLLEALPSGRIDDRALANAYGDGSLIHPDLRTNVQPLVHEWRAYIAYYKVHNNVTTTVLTDYPFDLQHPLVYPVLLDTTLYTPPAPGANVKWAYICSDNLGSSATFTPTPTPTNTPTVTPTNTPSCTLNSTAFYPHYTDLSGVNGGYQMTNTAYSGSPLAADLHSTSTVLWYSALQSDTTFSSGSYVFHTNGLCNPFSVNWSGCPSDSSLGIQ